MESHRTRPERIQIRSIAKISADILVFTSTHEHCIRSVDVCSEDDYEEVDPYVFHKETRVFAGRPNESGMQNGACENAQFNLPRGICYDAVNDRVLVCDTMNHRICVVEDGHVSTLVGTGASGNIDGHLDEASFNFPISVACASNYIVISEVHRIRLIMNNTVTTLGGSNSRHRDNMMGINLSDFTFLQACAFRMKAYSLLITTECECSDGTRSQIPKEAFT